MTAPVHREVSDVSLWTVVASGAVLLVSAALIYLFAWGLFLYFSGQAGRRGSTIGRFTQELPQPLPPEPRLQTDPHGDLLRLRQSEDQILNTYGWVDRNAGVVRIPIEQAMKLTVERGLPSRAARESSPR
jgi:hypothetical protein